MRCCSSDSLHDAGSEEAPMEASAWEQTPPSSQDVFVAAAAATASAASPPPSAAAATPGDATPPPTPLRPSSALRQSRMDVHQTQRWRRVQWSPSRHTLGYVLAHKGPDDASYSDASLQGLGPGAAAAAAQPPSDSPREAAPSQPSLPSSEAQRDHRSPSPAPSWSSWSSSSSATSSISQASQSPPPPPCTPPPTQHPPPPAGVATANWWWNGPSPPSACTSSPPVLPQAQAQPVPQPGPPMVSQAHPVPHLQPQALAQPQLLAQPLPQPLPQFVPQPLPCPPPSAALPPSQGVGGGGAARACRYTSEGFFISSLPPEPCPMDLELPPMTHNRHTDWENLINAVHARNQYWRHYLAYAIATNRELLRMSDQIYQQPRIRLQGARPAHAFLSPQCFETPATASLSVSQEHHCTTPLPGRRGPEEIICQEQEETDDPSPEK